MQCTSTAIAICPDRAVRSCPFASQARPLCRSSTTPQRYSIFDMYIKPKPLSLLFNAKEDSAPLSWDLQEPLAHCPAQTDGRTAIPNERQGSDLLESFFELALQAQRLVVPASAAHCSVLPTACSIPAPHALLAAGLRKKSIYFHSPPAGLLGSLCSV